MRSRSLLLTATAAALLFARPALADIVVYTAGPAELINALAKGFTAKSGVKVNVFQATTGKVMARIEAEASNPSVDVLISASWDTATDFAKRGWTAAYQSPNAETVPAFLKTDGVVAQGVSALAITWNSKSGTPRPNEWTDLANPAYKNLVTIPDPVQSGSSFELVAALQLKYGWKLFEDLKANGAIVPGPNAAALNPVLQGAKAAVFGAVDYISLESRNQGEPVEVIFPKSGTVVAPRPIIVLNWSKQQADAKKFVDYMLSPEGQAMVANAQMMPARTDIQAKRPLIKEIALLEFDTAQIYAKRKEILERFSQIFGRK
jgi:iron(III) transport system substrate-binding protein